jgi:hypothetical protein
MMDNADTKWQGSINIRLDNVILVHFYCK